MHESFVDQTNHELAETVCFGELEAIKMKGTIRYAIMRGAWFYVVFWAWGEMEEGHVEMKLSWRPRKNAVPPKFSASLHRSGTDVSAASL